MSRTLKCFYFPKSALPGYKLIHANENKNHIGIPRSDRAICCAKTHGTTNHHRDQSEAQSRQGKWQLLPPDHGITD